MNKLFIVLFWLFIIQLVCVEANSNSTSAGGINLTLTKFDSADPLNLTNSTVLTYTVILNVTNGTAFNITLQDVLPSFVTFVNSSPVNGTGLTFNISNLTVGHSFEANITVNVSAALSNGTNLTNRVNMSYRNSSGSLLTHQVLENTTVLNFCGMTLSSSFTLDRNLTCAAGFATIIQSNVTLDCNGHSVRWDQGPGLLGTDAIVSGSTNISNITVKNCVLRDNSAGGVLGFGISLTGTNNSLIQNNSVTTNGSSSAQGIRILSQRSTVVMNNSIFAFGTAASNIGILVSNSNNSVVTRNYISTTGTTTNHGIQLITNPSNNNVTYNVISTNGTSTNRGISLQGSSLSNVDNRLEHNMIITNGTLGSNGGIFFSTVTGTIVNNNSIVTNGSSSNIGIQDFGNPNTTITNNTVFSQGSSSGNEGIVCFGDNSVVANNNVTTNGTSSNIGIDGGGINSSFENNVVTTYGQTDSNSGFLISNTNGSVLNNVIVTESLDSLNYGIVLSTTNSLVDGNRVLTKGNFSDGILVSGALNTLIANNIITVENETSFGINIQSADSDNYAGNVLNATQWLFSTFSLSQNFSNTAFLTPDGSILLGSFSLPLTDEVVNKSVLNVSQNLAFLNTTNLSFMNVSGRVTLNNISVSNPQAIVDYADNGTFFVCSVCTFVSFSGGVFVYDVLHFTSYSSNQSDPAPSRGGGGSHSNSYYPAIIKKKSTNSVQEKNQELQAPAVVKKSEQESFDLSSKVSMVKKESKSYKSNPEVDRLALSLVARNERSSNAGLYFIMLVFVVAGISLLYLRKRFSMKSNKKDIFNGWSPKR